MLDLKNYNWSAIDDREYLWFLTLQDWKYEYNDSHPEWKICDNNFKLLRKYRNTERRKQMFEDWNDFVNGRASTRPEYDDYKTFREHLKEQFNEFLRLFFTHKSTNLKEREKP